MRLWVMKLNKPFFGLFCEWIRGVAVGDNLDNIWGCVNRKYGFFVIINNRACIQNLPSKSTDNTHVRYFECL